MKIWINSYVQLQVSELVLYFSFSECFFVYTNNTEMMSDHEKSKFAYVALFQNKAYAPAT